MATVITPDLRGHGFNPPTRGNYGRELAAMTQPFLLVAGLEDEAFIAEHSEPTFSQYTASGSFALLADTGHINLLISSELAPIVTNWLNHWDADDRGFLRFTKCNPCPNYGTDAMSASSTFGRAHVEATMNERDTDFYRFRRLTRFHPRSSALICSPFLKEKSDERYQQASAAVD